MFNQLNITSWNNPCPICRHEVNKAPSSVASLNTTVRAIDNVLLLEMFDANDNTARIDIPRFYTADGFRGTQVNGRCKWYVGNIIGLRLSTTASASTRRFLHFNCQPLGYLDGRFVGFIGYRIARHAAVIKYRITTAGIATANFNGRCDILQQLTALCVDFWLRDGCSRVPSKKNKTLTTEKEKSFIRLKIRIEY